MSLLKGKDVPRVETTEENIALGAGGGGVGVEQPPDIPGASARNMEAARLKGLEKAQDHLFEAKVEAKVLPSRKSRQRGPVDSTPQGTMGRGSEGREGDRTHGTKQSGPQPKRGRSERGGGGPGRGTPAPPRRMAWLLAWAAGFGCGKSVAVGGQRGPGFGGWGG